MRKRQFSLWLWDYRGGGGSVHCGCRIVGEDEAVFLVVVGLKGRMRQCSLWLWAVW